ncbi:MAG: RagB/SusD family nutrient uptake outer membrane protein, partial [Prevotella sp.]|nr:RagB/SusD family nutrient uptake outer membrane protein [Prevotella sp.]
MMKNKIFTVLTLGLAALGLSSCNDYLDKLPDERAELNTEEKITQLLVSAYPTCTNNLLVEVLSDNVDDNGRAYSSPAIVDQTYRFIDTTEEGNDSPYDIWGGYYRAVATVNEALQAVEAMGNPASLQGDVAEAKLIRAYSMFMLAQTFCMAWNPDKADEYLGLPYPLIPEQDLTAQYERGTLRQLYENINKDIEEALPHIADAAQKYTQPKYHFNVKAAYAFASRFNLYYMNYQKAIEYANMVLGSDPTAVMRNYDPYRELGRDDFANLWIRSNDQANIMLLATYS